MKKVLPVGFALNGLLIILSLFIVFHILILFKVIPYELVWGGRLTNTSQMIEFEIFSIIITLFMLAIVAIKSGIFKLNIQPRIIKIVFWIMFGIFLLNTVGNLVSNNDFEKLYLSPVTVLLSIFCLRVILD